MNYVKREKFKNENINIIKKILIVKLIQKFKIYVYMQKDVLYIMKKNMILIKVILIIVAIVKVGHFN